MRTAPDNRQRITITPRGKRAIRVIREAVAEVEAEWTNALGPNASPKLRDLLRDLNTPT